MPQEHRRFVSKLEQIVPDYEPYLNQKSFVTCPTNDIEYAMIVAQG